MNARRWWTRIVDAVTVVWLCAFLIVVGATYGLVSVPPGVLSAADRLLRWLIPVFVLDVVLLYRWSGGDFRTFTRHNSLLILTAIPWLRPLRVLRALNKLGRLRRRIADAYRRGTDRPRERNGD